MNFVAFNSIYRYITTYSSSLSQVPQTRLSSQDSVEDPEAERPVSALPGHHSAVFEPSGAWPHPRSNYTFLCFFLFCLLWKYIFSYTCGLWRKDRKACIACSLVLLQCRQGKMLRIFFLLKVLVLSFQFLQVGKQCQFCRNKLNIGKKGVI